MSEYLTKSAQYKKWHYSVLSSEKLDYLHATALEMMRVVVEIFEANNIRYMICGGTLLGAKTTGRFIPWDDDVDICVLEDDYDKMKDCLIKEVPSWMFVQCSQTEPKYYHGWIKIRDKKSVVEPHEPMYKENGVWLDVYRLTKTKSAMVDYLILQEYLDYLNRRCATGCISTTERDRRIADNNLIRRIEEARTVSSSNSGNNEVFLIWSASKIVVDKEWCFPLSKCMFEGQEVTTFNKPEAYLTRHYGEHYNELPSEAKRRVGICDVQQVDANIQPLSHTHTHTHSAESP